MNDNDTIFCERCENTGRIIDLSVPQPDIEFDFVYCGCDAGEAAEEADMAAGRYINWEEE